MNEFVIFLQYAKQTWKKSLHKLSRKYFRSVGKVLMFLFDFVCYTVIELIVFIFCSTCTRIDRLKNNVAQRDVYNRDEFTSKCKEIGVGVKFCWRQQKKKGKKIQLSPSILQIILLILLIAECNSLLISEQPTTLTTNLSWCFIIFCTFFYFWSKIGWRDKTSLLDAQMRGNGKYFYLFS